MKKGLSLFSLVVISLSLLSGSCGVNKFISEPSNNIFAETGAAIGMNYKGSNDFHYFYSDYKQGYKPHWYEHNFAKGTSVSTWDWAFLNWNPYYSLIMNFKDGSGKYHWLVLVNDGYVSSWEEKSAWYNFRVYLSEGQNQDTMPGIFENKWIVSHEKTHNVSSDFSCHAGVYIDDNKVLWNNSVIFSY